MKMFFAATVALALVASAFASPSLESQFAEFETSYAKYYATAEEREYRKTVFANNLKIAAMYQQHDPDAEYGVTMFSDLTREEFARDYLGSLPELASLDSLPVADVAKVAPKDVPTEWDWREENAMTPVKNQAQCGSCWAFSATEAVESANFLHGDKQLYTLAPQQLVDCVTKDFGCGGGWPSDALDYLVSVGGQEAESSYPYQGRNGKCSFDKTKVQAQVGNWTKIPSTEKDMMAWCSSYSPISIALDASFMQTYRSGVAHPVFCSKTHLNHAVILAGYGTASGKDFWLIRNSWSTNWGEDGYCRLTRKNNACGIQNVPISPVYN